MYSTIILKGITTLMFALWLSVFLTLSDLMSLTRSESFRRYRSNMCKLSDEKGELIPNDFHSGLLWISSVTNSQYQAERDHSQKPRASFTPDFPT